MSETLIPDFEFEVASPAVTNEENEGGDQIENEPEVVQSDDTDDVEVPEGADPHVIGAYQFYRDKGLITQEYKDFKGTTEELEQILENERIADREAAYSDIVGYAPDWAQAPLEILFNKGKDLTKEDWLKVLEVAAPSSDFSMEDLKDEKKASDYLRKFYMEKYEDSEDEAEERIDMLKDRGKLSKEAQTVFKQNDEVRQKVLGEAVETAKQTRQQKEQGEEAFNNSVIEVIKGSGWREDYQQAIAHVLFSGDFKRRIEHMITNPDVLPLLVSFAAYYDGKTINVDQYVKEALSQDIKRKKSTLQNYISSVPVHARTSQEKKQKDISQYEFE